uniref:26S proteasome non-ATPase regulatory subunit 10 n=1 Tax=Acrobeloides nanus TaxID=290746 RepID=A0A914C0T5_9BILA
MSSINEKYAELVEFLRQNSAENAKRVVTENSSLMRHRDDSGRLPIHWASAGGCVPFVEFSVADNPESLNSTDDSGWTPLMIAASAGRFDVCRFLLGSALCEVNHKNNNGQTALHYAASKNHLSILKLLVEADGDVNAQDKYGASPLHRASSQGHLDIVRFLLSCKRIRIDLSNREGDTPLHLACEDENDSVAILLAQNGADLKRQNKNEKTPIDLVRQAELKRKLLAFIED